jgi:hypothetical protein
MPIYSLRSVKWSGCACQSSHAKHSSQNSFALRMKVTIYQEVVDDLEGIFARMAGNDPVRADRKSGALNQAISGFHRKMK